MGDEPVQPRRASAWKPGRPRFRQRRPWRSLRGRGGAPRQVAALGRPGHNSLRAGECAVRGGDPSRGLGAIACPARACPLSLRRGATFRIVRADLLPHDHGRDGVGGRGAARRSEILLFLGAANRDCRRWEEPDRFDISRKTSGHVAFGYGILSCVGQAVARMEGEIILKALAERI